MKKMKVYTWCLMAIIVLFSCSENFFEEPLSNRNETENQAKDVASIIATMPSFAIVNENPVTRTAVTEDLQLVWSENDTIGIFPNEGYQVAFPMKDGAGSKNASFTGGGWALKPSSTYSAYSPLVGQFYLDKTKIPFSLEGQTQIGNNTTSHLGVFDYMIAVNEAVDDLGNVSFGFQHLVGMLHLKITMPEAGTYNKIEIRTSGELKNKGSFSLLDGIVTASQSVGVQTLNLQDITLEGANQLLEVYMAIPPVDLTGHTLIAKVFKDDGKVYTATLKSRKYDTGAFYNQARTAKADYDSSVLPIVSLYTPDGSVINSKEEYKKSLLTYVDTDGNESFADSTNLKGRGNSTWAAPKKPYAIKFTKKKSLLGLPEDKSWVLLANYYDSTLVRNDLAMYMGREYSCLDWTPCLQQVELIMNGEYKGIYQLGEKVKISKKRVNVSDGGILMEVDVRATSESDARYFNVSHIGHAINIKDPDVEYDDENFCFARDYLTAADAALFSSDFTDPDNGWQKYLDMDSFVDWYIINEISKNLDSKFASSCYMNLKRDGKLKMGPLWDYDLAFGGYPSIWGEVPQNTANNPEGFYIKTVPWFERLFQDPVFKNRVKERYNYFYSQKQDIFAHIDTSSSLIADMVYKDNALWGTICDPSLTSEEVKTTYIDKVTRMKTWIGRRMDWLKQNIDKL